MPRLLVRTPGGPKAVPVGDEAVTIGRTNDNTIPLEGEGISRRHAQVLFVGKGYEVVDLGSRNGTKVNGQKVPRALLKPGDVISVGGVEIVFEDAAAGGSPGGLELEELDLGGAAASAPSAAAAAATGAFPAAGGTSGECLLRFVAGEKQGTDVPLRATRTTVGRKSTNTLSFEDAAVSGVHCEITREANGYVLRDLGSTNGTQVDGEPVVETLLHHNARIRIGAQRAIFVDPTVADIESSLAAEDPSEWGLMKGEIDLAAVRARGERGGLVAALVVVVAAGAAGWFAFRANAGASALEVPSVKDNRIGDHSFVDGVVRWFPPGEEGGATARVVGGPESPRGASGVTSLEVSPPSEGLGIVEWSTAASGGGDAAVSPDTAYEISARVGSGRGAVVLTWVVAGRPGLVREDSSPPVEGSSSWPETKAIVVAPAQATGVRVGLLALGGSPATFDDVVFRRAEGGGPPAFEAGDLRIRIDASGCLEAVRVGEILFTEAGLAPAADTPPEALLGSSLSSGPSLDGPALVAEGMLPAGPGFTMRVAPAATGVAIACLPKGGEGGFALTCPAGVSRGSVTVVLEKSALVLPEQESFSQAGVKKLILGTSGGGSPFVLSSDPASPGFTLSSKRTARGLRLHLAPPAQVPQGVDGATVTLSVDLSREDQAAGDLMREAASRARAGKRGAAAAAYEQVTLAYHYLPAFRDPAAKELQAILDDGRGRLREAQALLAGSKRFQAVSAPDLERAAALGTALSREFEGHPLGEDGAKVAADATAALQAIRAEAVEARVERLFLRAVDYEANRQPMLALLLYEEVARLAPEGDERRDRAEEKRKSLADELRRELAARYGTRN